MTIHKEKHDSIEGRPVFEDYLRALKNRCLPDGDCIALKAYAQEPVAAQIKRHCLHLQGVLFALSLHCDVSHLDNGSEGRLSGDQQLRMDLSEDVLRAYFEATGDLIAAVAHLRDARLKTAGRKQTDLKNGVASHEAG